MLNKLFETQKFFLLTTVGIISMAASAHCFTPVEGGGCGPSGYSATCATGCVARACGTNPAGITAKVCGEPQSSKKNCDHHTAGWSCSWVEYEQLLINDNGYIFCDGCNISGGGDALSMPPGSEIANGSCSQDTATQNEDPVNCGT